MKDSNIKIVGHRGAAGLITENTLDSLSRAMELGVDAVEVDFHLTKDGYLIAHHDSSLTRMTASRGEITELDLAEIQGRYKAQGKHIPSIDEVFEKIGGYPVYIELKSDGSAEALLSSLRRYPKVKDFIVTSFRHRELKRLQGLEPDIRLHAATYVRPWHTVALARRRDWHGITLHHSLLNPITYWFVKRAGLNLIVFSGVKSLLSIDRPGRLRHIMRRYPKAQICTNRPDVAIKIRRELEAR